MGVLLSDLRYSLRTLLKDPAFTLIAVLSLALGIGANSTVFSVAEAALLRSWPAQAPDRLAKIVARTPQGSDDYFSYPDYQDLSQQNRAFEGILAWARHGRTLRIGSESREILDDLVSPNYFEVLGLRTQLGRTFSPAGPNDESTVVISDDLWHRAFHADPTLVGKQILLTGRSFTVIGIGPPHFRGLGRGVPTDAWLMPSVDLGTQGAHDRGLRDFELLGRLKSGATPQQAQAELETIGRRMADAYPAFDKARNVTLVSEQQRLRDAAFPTFLLLAAVALVLLISSANVAGLVLARSETRRREIAVRLALGAGRTRLIRQLLTESALLALTGAALGLLLARWLLKLQPALLPPQNFDIGLNLRLDASVVVFTLAVSAVAVLIFGLAPALGATKTSLTPALKSGAEAAIGEARRLTLRNGLVLGEIALSVVLLTASGLLLRSLLYSRGIRLGFDAQKNLVFFDLEPGVGGYNFDRSLAYFDRVRGDVSGLPGVRHATYARRMLLTDSGGGAEQRVAIAGVALPQGQPNIPIKFNAVGPGYFQTVGTRILRGRDFTAADSTSGAKVVLISETMAQRFWPGGDPIGRRIVAEGKDCQIVGVVEDAKINDVHEPAEPYIYFPFAQSALDWGTLIVETAVDPRALTETIRSAIRREDQNVPVNVFTLHFVMQEAYWSDQIAAGFVGGLSALGMFLASVGLYGVIAYRVTRRRHEIGIRMALGAERRDVLRLVLGQGLRLAAIGTGAGLAAAFAMTRLMSNLLYGVKPDDPLAFASSSLIAILVALTASVVPALRASRVEPNVALRYE